MSGFTIRREEEEVDYGSQNYLHYRDDKMTRRIDFRYTMKSLNQTFVNACQEEISRAPDCVLVPLMQKYLLYLRDTLAKLNEDPNEADGNSFTNIGKFYDSISKQLQRVPSSFSSSNTDKVVVFNNNNKELPPLKRKVDSESGSHFSHSIFNSPNATPKRSSPQKNSPNPYSVFQNDEKQSPSSLTLSSSTQLNSVPPNKLSLFSGFSGFNNVTTSINSFPSTPNYFNDTSTKQLSGGFGVDVTQKSSANLSFSLPPSSHGSPSLESKLPTTFQINSNVSNSSLSNFPSSGMSTMSSPLNSLISKVSPVGVSNSSPVFASQSSFGLSSSYSNGISPIIAPIMLPKAGGFETSKTFSSSPMSGAMTLNFTRPNTSTPPQKLAASDFSFAGSIASSSPQPTISSGKDSDDEDVEPPKNEFVPVVESNSLYNIKCKVFCMIGGIYKDKGVGQLYVKKLASGRYQLVVRGDNTLGTIILNLWLSKNLPLSKKSAKDIITVDPLGNNGEPATVLIRVKDESSATELLNKLTQFKSSAP